MTVPLRVLIVGRRFWPHTTIDTAGHLMQVSRALVRRGVQVDVLTPRYSSSWPVELSYQEITVHRPIITPKRDWSIGRYTRSLTQWLRSRSGAYDVIFCDSIREESLAAVEASRSTGCPIMVRSSRWGDHSDTYWWTTSRAARRCGVIGKMADAVIANSADCERALLAEGFDARRIHRIETGFAAGPQRTATARRLARQSLAAANIDLATDPQSRVLICASGIVRGRGANLLVSAARRLITRYPNLRIWLIGDGPHRDWMHHKLKGDGVRSAIAMPGSFSDCDDLFAAADLFFQGDDEGLEYWLPTAISAAVPVVLADSQSIRTVVAGADPALADAAQWFQPSVSEAAEEKSVRVAVANVLDDLQTARDKASSLRRSLLRARPQVDAIDSYLYIMQTLSGKRSAARPDRSVEATT